MRKRVLIPCLVALAAVIVFFVAVSNAGDERALHKLPKAERAARIKGAFEAVRVYRKGLERALAFVKANPALFPTEQQAAARVIPREHKEKIWSTWQSLLEYNLALDSIGRYYEQFYSIRDKEHCRDAFLVEQMAFLAQYRFALDFIATAENDPTFDTVLNEPVPEIGLPAGSYAQYKYRFLHVGRATEFAAMRALQKYYGPTTVAGVSEAIEEDKGVIWKHGKGGGELLTLKNGLDIVKKKGVTVWFPVQAGVSEWMGDVKVRRKHRSLISEKQIHAMLPKLKPGDVMLQRREWFLSNIGLPGYWPHAALYIGTPAERRTFFGGANQGLADWLKEHGAPDFEALLKKAYPKKYAEGLKPQEENHTPRVIEAMSEGVCFTTLEHSAAADSVVVLRPRLGKVEIAKAIQRAFHYQGRPYDFDFDFLTDATLVCTELVYKAFEPRTGMKGITLPVADVMGRPTVPANLIAKQFDEHFGTAKQQFDMVLFLDADERAQAAKASDLATFRKSWQRPKWHILTQGTRYGQE